jgi:hypothetical protein
VMQRNNTVGRYATVDSFARSSLAQAKARFDLVEHTLIPAATKDLVSCSQSSPSEIFSCQKQSLCKSE